MAKPPLSGAEPSPAPAFEQSLAELETVVKELESGELALEKAIQLFERGVLLSATCRKQLDDAETRVEMLIRHGNGVKVQPFES